MPIPDYETLMLPVLRLFAEGKSSVSECVPHLQRQFDISDEDAAILVNSGKTTLLQDRAHWARTYLSKAGLLSSPKRSIHVITDQGREVLASSPPRIDKRFLTRYPDFRNWLELSRSTISDIATHDVPSIPAALDITPVDNGQTPEDAMEAAYGLLNAALRDDLLTLLLQLTPQRFEHVILDLLMAMGYGGGVSERGMVTKMTGDGGIDGISMKMPLALMPFTFKLRNMPLTIALAVLISSSSLAR